MKMCRGGVRSKEDIMRAEVNEEVGRKERLACSPSRSCLVVRSLFTGDSPEGINMYQYPPSKRQWPACFTKCSSH